jgi:hypothetical protein
MPSGSPDVKPGLWSDPEPSYYDPGVIPFFGADPCWTPARELGKGDDADHKYGAPCLLCHGDGVLVVLPSGDEVVLEGEVEPGSHRYCPRCQRYGLDHRMGPPPGVPPDPEQPVESRPGYVAKGNVEVPEKYARQLKG